MNMKHFKREVPEAIQEKIHALAQYVHEEWSNVIVISSRSYGAMGEVQLSEIQGNYVSGWMPNQDGGFSIDCLYQNDQDKTYHFTEKQTEAASSQATTCWEMFLHDNALDSELSYDDLTEEQKTSFADYENEWFDPALLQFQVFTEGWKNYDSEDKPTITMRLSINYKDAPYYREGGAEDIKSVILEIDEFMNTDIEVLAEQFDV
jgi:hypothetical protein